MTTTVHQCPECGDELEIEFDETATVPQEVTCDGCNTDFEIEFQADKILALHALEAAEDDDDEEADEDETVIGVEDEDTEEEDEE